MAKRYDLAALSSTVAGWSEESVTLSGVEVPQRAIVDLSYPHWPTTIRLYVVTDEDAGPVATGIQALSESEVTSYQQAHKLLAQVAPMEHVVRFALSQVSGVRAQRALLGDFDPRGLPENASADELNRAAEWLNTGHFARTDAWEVSQARRRRIVTRELAKEVAVIYRGAHAEGQPPTVAVAEHFKVSHRTASRWVAQARDLGELGPAAGTKPGEAN